MLPESIANLAQSLRKLPGIGIKSSQKMAIDILQMKQEEMELLLTAINQTRTRVKFCHRCGYFAENYLCDICSNDNRNHHQICIVENATDVIALEKSEIYRGVYHVLEKLISPLDNIFANNTTIDQLLMTIKEESENGKHLELILFRYNLSFRMSHLLGVDAKSQMKHPIIHHYCLKSILKTAVYFLPN